MKTELIIVILLLASLINLSSCLESGLGELDTYSDADITAINFEYRWAVAENPDDPWAGEKLQVKTLTTSAIFSNQLIECQITTPTASGSFTETERANVALNNLNAYVTISPGATIEPVGNAPALGERGDFSQSELYYQVTSADKKNTKRWQLVIISFK